MSRFPTDVLSQHIAIVGKTGAGKTYCAKGLVEQMLDAQRRVVVLDPTGAWWGLRSLANGEPGFKLPIIGGEHGDVPLGVEHAERIAQWLTAAPRSAVLDLSEMLIGERHRFVEQFADALYRLNRTPLHLVIDEADEFAPQNPLPETRRMLHHVDRIVRRGRIRGFRVMLITQRPAVLHKNVLTQVNALVALRLTAPQDRKAIEAWVEGQADIKKGREVLDSLARLQRGEGWVWAPELDVLERMRFPSIRTFDSSRSPEDGDTVAEPTTPAIDIGELRVLLAPPEGPTEPQHAPSDRSPALLELDRQRAYAEGHEAGHKEGFIAGCAEGYAKGLSEAHRAGWDSHAAAVAAALDTIIYDAPEPCRIEIPPPAPPPVPYNATPAPARQAAPSGLPRGEEATLAACIQYPRGLRREQLTVLTGYKRSSRDAYIQRLRDKGLVAVDRGGMSIVATDAGRAALPNAAPLPRGAALQRFWLDRLPAGEREVLQVLIKAYPRAVARSRIDDLTGYKRSSRDAYLQRLGAKELVADAGRGEVVASKELFT